MGSFGSATFKERGQSAQSFPTWSKAGKLAVLHVPGGDVTIIQRIGVDLPRLALQVRCTADELSDLRSAVGTSATLTFSAESTTARLVNISGEEVSADKDTYFATLNLIRSAGAIGGSGAAWLTETGDIWLTESGDPWILE